MSSLARARSIGGTAKRDLGCGDGLGAGPLAFRIRRVRSRIKPIIGGIIVSRRRGMQPDANGQASLTSGSLVYVAGII